MWIRELREKQIVSLSVVKININYIYKTVRNLVVWPRQSSFIGCEYLLVQFLGVRYTATTNAPPGKPPRHFIFSVKFPGS